jgi:hypothetical protein
MPTGQWWPLVCGIRDKSARRTLRPHFKPAQSSLQISFAMIHAGQLALMLDGKVLKSSVRDSIFVTASMSSGGITSFRAFS